LDLKNLTEEKWVNPNPTPLIRQTFTKFQNSGYAK
jgi:hypothetical protein